MSYGGSVLPLTTVEDSTGLTAEREVIWDFAPGAYPDGEPRQWGAEVTDSYTLHNTTEEVIAVTALYPFTGSFDSLTEIRPHAAADGGAVETTLYAGAYSGGFQSTFGAEIPDTMNLDGLSSWEGYQALLGSGAYLEQALGDYPVLDIPAVVYEFSDFAAPHETYPAATQAVSIHIDEEETTIFTYGFNGMECGEGFRRYSYFVPDGMRNEPDLKLLVVLGEDIGAYGLQGYEDGGCGRGEEIEGVSCAVVRSETTLDAVLDRALERLDARGRSLLVESDEGLCRLPLSEIRWLEVMGNYVTIHAGRDYTLRKPLKDLEPLLDESFFRTGRSFLVNLRFVKEVTRTQVTLTDASTVPLSRRRYDAIHHAIISYF